MADIIAGAAAPQDDLFAPRPALAAAPPAWSPQAKPLEGLRTLLTIMLGVYAAAEAGLIALFAAETAVFAAVKNPGGLESAPIQAIAQVGGLLAPFIQPFTLIVTLACAVCYLLFVHRAAKNLVLSKAHGLEVSPGWAVGWSFVPFANLFKTPSVMRQIWRASENPVRPKLDVPGVFNVWWGCWLASNFGGTIAGRMGEGLENLPPEQMFDRFAPLALLGAVASVLGIVATFALMNIVKQITGLQRDLRDATLFS